MNLPHGGERDAGNNPEHVEKGRQVGLSDFPGPRCKEHGYGRGGLEHLDKRHRQVQIDDIGADEGARVEDADGENSSAVEARREGYFLARIEKRRCSGEDLCCNGSVDEMPACEKYGCIFF